MTLILLAIGCAWVAQMPGIGWNRRTRPCKTERRSSMNSTDSGGDLFAGILLGAFFSADFVDYSDAFPSQWSGFLFAASLLLDGCCRDWILSRVSWRLAEAGACLAGFLPHASPLRGLYVYRPPKRPVSSGRRK